MYLMCSHCGQICVLPIETTQGGRTNTYPNAYMMRTHARTHAHTHARTHARTHAHTLKITIFAKVQWP